MLSDIFILLAKEEQKHYLWLEQAELTHLDDY